MSAEPYTHADPNVDRRWETCRCSVCGIVAQCTPAFDFYAKKDGDPLECESCFHKALGIPVIDASTGGGLLS